MPPSPARVERGEEPSHDHLPGRRAPASGPSGAPAAAPGLRGGDPAIRPLRVVLLNGGREKSDGDLRIARLLGNTALQIELTILRDQHAAERDVSPHLLHFYRSFAEVQARSYDALVVVGYDHLEGPRSGADRDGELAAVIAWSFRQGHAGLVIGAAAFAVLGLCHGVGARRLPARRHGVVRHQLVAKDEPLLRGHDRCVWVPVSGRLGLGPGDLPADGSLASLVESGQAGRPHPARRGAPLHLRDQRHQRRCRRAARWRRIARARLARPCPVAVRPMAGGRGRAAAASARAGARAGRRPGRRRPRLTAPGPGLYQPRFSPAMGGRVRCTALLARVAGKAAFTTPASAHHRRHPPGGAPDMLTNRAKYAIKALLYLAQQRGKGPVQAGLIAEHEHIPLKFLELILLQLRNNGIIRSKVGKGGGHELVREPGRSTSSPWCARSTARWRRCRA